MMNKNALIGINNAIENSVGSANILVFFVRKLIFKLILSQYSGIFYMELQIKKGEETENPSKRIIKTLFEQDDFWLQSTENKEEITVSIPAEVRKNIIHFYFCLEGSAVFEFGPHYSREIQKQQNYFFYNPEKELPFTLKLSTGARLVFLSIA